MAKHKRHAAIRDIVHATRVANQEQLRELLLGRGIDVAQATLSRDIRELRLAKVSDAEGRSHYRLPSEERDNVPPLLRLMPALFVGAEAAGHLLVVKTLAGGAQAIAEAIDWEEWPEILGTIGGDDTILIILRKPAGAAGVIARLEELAGVEDQQ